MAAEFRQAALNMGGIGVQCSRRRWVRSLYCTAGSENIIS